MKPHALRCTIAAALLAAGAAQAAEIVIYKQPNFTGDALTRTGDDPNLTDDKFLDQASSVIVKSGRWQLCSQPNYQGDCKILERGQYATLDQVLNHRVESLREVTQVAANTDKRFDERREVDRVDRDRRYGDDRYGNDRSADGRYRDGRRDSYADNRRWGAGSIELFSAQGYRGRGVLLERDAQTLGAFEDNVSSIIVHEGVWEVCTDPRFEGQCRTVEPGRYPSLGRYANRVGSVRRIG